MKNVFALTHEVFHYCVLSNDMKTGFNTTTNNLTTAPIHILPIVAGTTTAHCHQQRCESGKMFQQMAHMKSVHANSNSLLLV
jgi:Ni2+-binding GTPase involved in maturation of urease and hydrogenase